MIDITYGGRACGRVDKIKGILINGKYFSVAEINNNWNEVRARFIASIDAEILRELQEKKRIKKRHQHRNLIAKLKKAGRGK